MSTSNNIPKYRYSTSTSNCKKSSFQFNSNNQQNNTTVSGNYETNRNSTENNNSLALPKSKQLSPSITKQIFEQQK